MVNDRSFRSGRNGALRGALHAALSALLAAAASAQEGHTAPPSPQTPTKSVAAAVPRAKALAAAAQIDRLLDKGLQKRAVPPTAIVDDATFARRAWLQAVGRIPTLAEIEAFLADPAADKRQALVDRLLDSPGYTSNESNFWFDLLRVKSRQRQVSGEPFAHWIRESIRAGMPYDEFVRAMLTASGPANAEGNGATGYLLRDANMPHDAMANTLRLFLGTRVECAQCHNHPFDKWTQRDFYAMAAFYGGLRYRVELDRNLQQELRQLITDGDERDKQAARRAVQLFATGIAGSGTGMERLPEDYKYDDAKPREPIAAATIYGPDVKLPKPQLPERGRPQRGFRPQRQQPPQQLPEVDSRKVFADWLASAQNPRFARVISNRLWKRTFGRGLIEPVDDLKDDTQAVLPELETYLEKLLVELRFDLRQFERVLLLTKLFQQEALPGEPPAEGYAFQAPLLRRMTAEQVWDSMLTLLQGDVDQHLQPTDARAKEAYERQAALSNGTPEQIAELVRRPYRPDQDRIREQAAAMQRAFADLGAPEQQQARLAQRELAAARRKGDAAAADRALGKLEALGLPRPGDRAARGRDGERLRASDLLQPAPPGHPLREFGQSDRETIDASSLAATVPQALTLMNGPLASGDSQLHRALARAANDDERIRLAFLTELSRPPRPYEVAIWRDLLAKDQAKGSQDLIWVLCNCDEFRFRR